MGYVGCWKLPKFAVWRRFPLISWWSGSGDKRDYTVRLQFMSTKVEELKEKGTIKVIQIESSQCDEASLSHSVVQPLLSPNSASVSSGSVDTDLLSSSDSSSSRTSWPVSFPVPQFSYDSELKLDRGNATYKNDGTPLIPDPKPKSNIL